MCILISEKQNVIDIKKRGIFLENNSTMVRFIRFEQMSRIGVFLNNIFVARAHVLSKSGCGVFNSAISIPRWKAWPPTCAAA